jgi:2-amino-4-hydroxy-6-hydroxymethyldihydropteridine diphosphokinase
MKNFKNTAFVGLGSNKGDKFGYLKTAVEKINEDEISKVAAASSVYESTPYGKSDQDNFLNAVIKISTGREFMELLNLLKSIENDIGRTESERWGPREIDLDLLFYNDLVYSDEEVAVPHEEIQYRDFVLVPLCEINPDLMHPALNIKICEMYVAGSEKHIINKLTEKIL